LIFVEWFWRRLFICQVTVQLQNRRQVKGLTAMLMPAKHSPMSYDLGILGRCMAIYPWCLLMLKALQKGVVTVF
jgi:hypothetical protein